SFAGNRAGGTACAAVADREVGAWDYRRYESYNRRDHQQLEWTHTPDCGEPDLLRDGRECAWPGVADAACVVAGRAGSCDAALVEDVAVADYGSGSRGGYYCCLPHHAFRSDLAPGHSSRPPDVSACAGGCATWHNLCRAIARPGRAVPNRQTGT